MCDKTTTTTTITTQLHDDDDDNDESPEMDGDYVDDDDDDVEDEGPDLCSYVATGKHPSFQPIYVCHTCSSSSSNNTTMGCTDATTTTTTEEEEDNHHDTPRATTKICVCQSCANVCHADRGCEIEYVGIGECYCDCATDLHNNNDNNDKRCCLQEASRVAAEEHGIVPGARNLHLDFEDVEDPDRGEEEAFPFACAVHTLPILTGAGRCRRLSEQASELVRHTKDTHWIPGTADATTEPWSELETLALAIFHRHSRAYGLENIIHNNNNNKEEEPPQPPGTTTVAGAEWWVQVKPVVSSSSSPEEEGHQEEAVDLHYDKDEVLAETFGLGSFPTLSTVTYFSGGGGDDSSSSSPTIVYPHTYDQGEHATMAGDVLLSHPEQGKHVVFDGRLLHGAPSHPKLRRHRPSNSSSSSTGGEEQQQRLRVTFLVNLWTTKKPSGVQQLSSEIREHLARAAAASSSSSPEDDDRTTAHLRSCCRSANDDDDRPLLLTDAPLPVLFVTDDHVADQNEIRLPFVSADATWIDFDDEEESLLVSMYPPPDHHDSTVRIRYDEGLEPWFHRTDEVDESEEEEEEAVAANE